MIKAKKDWRVTAGSWWLAAGGWLLVTATVVGIAPTAEAQAFGRLFSTPEKRAELDRIRREPPRLPPPVERRKREVRPIVQRVTIDGVVVRSSGPNTSWINGAEIAGDEVSREGFQVETGQSADMAGGTVRIVLPDGVQTVPLKPGQQVDVLRRQVVDVYQRGSDDAEAPLFEDRETARITSPPEGSESQ